MRTHHLAVIGGDGIGPAVTAAGLAALRAAADRFGFAVRTTHFRRAGRRHRPARIGDRAARWWLAGLSAARSRS